jgi:hypothetical protein
LGGSLPGLADLLSRLRRDRSLDGQYPDRLASLEAAQRGFNNCERASRAASGPAQQAIAPPVALPITSDTWAKAWYERGYPKPVPTTLKAALAISKEQSPGNRFWEPVTNAPGLREICAALNAINISCDYNTRYEVSQFLAFYGKGLFPAAGGTNPYCTTESRERRVRDGTDNRPDDCFIGRPQQNKMLADAIRKNRALFKNGDISVEAVRKSWK